MASTFAAGSMDQSSWRRFAEPPEIAFDPFREFEGRALAVGVVEAEDEATARAAGEKPVQERGARVADVDSAGRRRRETNNWRTAMRSGGHGPS